MTSHSPPPSALIKLLTWLSVLPVALIVGLTFVDVFARYLVSMPIKGSVEIIENAMALLIFSALPIVTHQRGHVTVSLIDGLFHGSVKKIQKSLCDLLSTFALGVLAWRLAVQGLAELESGASSVVLGLPQAPFVFAMCLLACVTTLITLGLAIQHFKPEEANP